MATENDLINTGENSLSAEDIKLELNTSGDGEDSESGRGSPFSTLSVLAQVASARLEKEPRKSDKKKGSSKLTKRNVQTMDRLSLSQVAGLSDKLLVNMFSDTSADEMKKQYTYTCFFVPDTCDHNITVYGNELKARLRMKDHLQEHIREMKRKKDNDESFDFTAEPVHARKKRLAAEKALEKKLKKIVVAGGPKGKGGKGMKVVSPSKYTSLLPKMKPGMNVMAENQLLLQQKTKVKKNIVRHFANKQIGIRLPSGSPSSTVTAEETLSGLGPEVNYASELTEAPEATGGEVEVESQVVEMSNEQAVKEMSANLEQNQAFIVELLSRTMPYHDHSYTSVFGKKPGIESLDIDSDEEQQGATVDDKNVVTVKFSDDANSNITNPNHFHIPIIRLGRIPLEGSDTDSQTFPEGQQTNILQTAAASAAIEGAEAMVQRPYPPMPKSDLAMRGRLYPKEEVVSDGEETSTTVGKRFKKKTSSQWDEERKLALKCIRELRIRKGYKDDTNLVCKICKDKTFTATATLMYHYRSHAGIKPFVCLICNTTFTRQHSLNYHMLIHNNQSRFTCKDCGRKFRHPSHFKEHLRRHTGETPFHCTDCPLRFKTRNTYKRHLMTRHGKLLTASGIKLMPPEDFLKVKTKFYSRRNSGNGEQEDEDDIEDNLEEDDDIGEDDEEEMMDVGGPDHGASTSAQTSSASPTETPAANKLLQFCAQVANQMGQVMPTQG